MPAQTLIDWYKKNKRELPWRETRDPYKIWLSEIILQQTRVAQGLSYYNAFVNEYPTVNDLADANEEEVLKLWQGLGYYSRARNLHATAKHVSKNLNSEFPDSSSELLSLKGVGPYTAAAIASFCFQEAVPVLDGNVYRFLSRYYGCEIPINTPKGHSYFKDLAEQIIPEDQPDEFNQAIMEFGALHCKAKGPLCETCPLNGSCLAYEKGIQNELPVKQGKTAVKQVSYSYFVMKCDDEILFRKREGKGIWQGLYEFYLKESDHREGNSVEEELEVVQSEFSLDIEKVSRGPNFTHILSHRKIQARFIELDLNSKPEIKNSNFIWVPIAEISLLPIPRLIEKYLQESSGLTF